MAVDSIAAGLDHIHAYLAFVPRRRDVRLSEQLAVDCAAGCKRAKRVLASGIFTDPKPEKPVRKVRPAPTAPAMTAHQKAALERSEKLRRRLERDSAETGLPWHVVGSHRDSLYVEHWQKS